MGLNSSVVERKAQQIPAYLCFSLPRHTLAAYKCLSWRLVHTPANMKVMLLSLLLLLLCSAQVLTLKCYTCDGEDDKICKSETICPPLKDYCRTYQKGDVFSRTCEFFCAEDYFTTCCTTDLC